MEIRKANTKLKHFVINTNRLSETKVKKRTKIFIFGINYIHNIKKP